MSAVDLAPAPVWPPEDLEALGHCPCCGSSSRYAHVRGLTDCTMGVAPGEWTMWRCNACRCAYLDPRPTQASIGRAYLDYHTHGTPTGLRIKALNLARRGKFELIRRTVGLGSPVQSYKIRHMPPAKPGDRVLDVGFGAGGFLEVARWFGYEVLGIDFDPDVVANARARGHQVRHAGLPGSGLAAGQFSQVTLCNVLEHLPAPVEALAEIWRLLRPGGRLWLTQPNLGAPGAAIFGRFWRGYEAPRHLVLWEPDDLMALLTQCGFTDVGMLPTDPTMHDLYYRESELQRRGFVPGRAQQRDYEAAAALAASTPRATSREQGESLTLVGFRPATRPEAERSASSRQTPPGQAGEARP
jgi:SAM-dependent methyltransferase